MINVFIYISSILLMFIICLEGSRKALRAPYKIKFISILVYFFMILRFTSLGLLLFINNIKNLYWLKWIYFLDFLAVPTAMIICFYICIKNNKFNLRYIICIMLIILSILMIFISKYSLKMNIFNEQFYIMKLLAPINIYIFFIIINLVLLILCFMKHSNKHINKTILYLIFFSIIINIADIILSIFNVNVFPPNVLGNIIWIYTLYTSVNKIVK